MHAENNAPADEAAPHGAGLGVGAWWRRLTQASPRVPLAQRTDSGLLGGLVLALLLLALFAAVVLTLLRASARAATAWWCTRKPRR